MRALAVIAVFLTHRGGFGWTMLGHTGVLAFFALSGFLIVGILHKERLAVEAGAKTVSAAWWRFFIRRTMRIFPIFYLTIGVMALAALIGGADRAWWSALPWHLSYLSNVYVAAEGWEAPLVHLWTLAIEEQFYLFMAPLLLAVPARLHLRICLAVAAVGVAFHLAKLGAGSRGADLRVDSLTNFAFLALGGAVRLKPPAFTARTAVAAAICCGSALLAAAVVRTDAAVWIHEIRTLGSPVLAAGLVAAIATAQRSWLVAALEAPPLVWLGRISYGFYLYHVLLPHLGPFGGPTGVAVDFAAACLVAYASFRLIEAPLIALGQRMTARPAASLAVAA